MTLSEKEKAEWKEKYINRFVEHGLSRNLGEDNFNASDEIDYEDDLVISADESLIYWADQHITNRLMRMTKKPGTRQLNVSCLEATKGE